MHLALAFNPSHLEIVIRSDGSVPTVKDRPQGIIPYRVSADRNIHGDAGHVLESRGARRGRGYGNLPDVPGLGPVSKTWRTEFSTSSSNTKVGFTTSRQDDATLSEYCTDVAKMIQLRARSSM